MICTTTYIYNQPTEALTVSEWVLTPLLAMFRQFHGGETPKLGLTHGTHVGIEPGFSLDARTLWPLPLEALRAIMWAQVANSSIAAYRYTVLCPVSLMIHWLWVRIPHLPRLWSFWFASTTSVVILGFTKVENIIIPASLTLGFSDILHRQTAI